jgi:hypothetical protein
MLLPPLGTGEPNTLEAGLGKLVKFELRERPASGQTKPRGDAQILLFTGVRYERGTTWPVETRRDPSRPKRRRG